jgi:hypothetical protein
MLGSSWIAAQLTASQEGLSSMSEWVSSGKILWRLVWGLRFSQQWRFILWYLGLWYNEVCVRTPPPSSELKTEAVCFCETFNLLPWRWKQEGSSEMLVAIYQTRGSHTPEDSSLHSHFKNLRSHVDKKFWAEVVKRAFYCIQSVFLDLAAVNKMRSGFSRVQ